MFAWYERWEKYLGPNLLGPYWLPIMLLLWISWTASMFNVLYHWW